MSTLKFGVVQVYQLTIYIIGEVITNLSRFLSKNFKYILALIILTGSFYKPLRSMPGMSFIANYNYYLIIVLYLFIPLFWIKNKILTLDALIYCSFITLLTSYIVAGVQTDFMEQTGILARFAIPVSVYFIFRYVHIDAKLFLNSIYAFILIAAVFLLLEFFASNYLGFPVFAFTDFWKEQGITQVDVGGLKYPFLGLKLPPWGIMGRPQATGSLFSALMIFSFVIWRSAKTKGKDKQWALFMTLIAFFSLFLSGSKTGIVIAIWMLCFLMLGFNPLTFLIVILMGLCGSLFFIANWQDIPAIVKPFLGSFDALIETFSQTEIRYWLYIIFGQGESTSVHDTEFTSEIGLQTTFVYIGLLNCILFCLIIYTYIKHCLLIEKVKSSPLIRAGLFFTITLILGSLHYETLFRYPANVLALSVMGMTERHLFNLQTG